MTQLGNRHFLPGASIVVLLALAALLLPWLGETLFNSKGEPREAIVAVTMLQSGNWVLPVSHGGDIPFKPPFMAWIIALIAKVFNGGEVNEYISRLPSALAAIIMCMAGFGWARRVRGDRFAMIFALVTMSSVEVFRAAMACRLDMVLTACMVGAIYMLYDIRENRPRHTVGFRYLGVVALLTCATLTKGPVGALLPCAVAGAYRLFRRDRFFPVFFTMAAIALLSLIVPAWWYYEAYKLGGQEFYDLAWEENIGRLTGTMSYDSHVNPWWYNFMTLAAGLLPWTLLLIFCLFAARKVRPMLPPKPAGLLALVAFVVIVGFYCIPASKRSVYLLPAYPFACYGIACLIETAAMGRPLKVFTWVIAVLSVAVPLLFAAIQIFGMPEALRLTAAPAPWWGYALLLLPMAAGIAWMANRHSPAGHLMVMVWALCLVYPAVIMPSVLNPKSDYHLLPRISAEGGPDAKVLTIRPEPTYRLFTLNFYLDDAMRCVDSFDEARRYPSGTVFIVPARVDTTGQGAGFDIRPLSPRSCDHREPINIAIRK